MVHLNYQQGLGPLLIIFRGLFAVIDIEYYVVIEYCRIFVLDGGVIE